MTEILRTLELIVREVNIRQCCFLFLQDVKKFDIKKACCGYTLTNGILAIAVMDVVVAVLGILPLVLMVTYQTIFRLMMNMTREKPAAPIESAKAVESTFSMFLTTLCLVICICLLEFYLAMLLLNGTAKQKVKTCFHWWKLAVVGLTSLLFLISTIVIPDWSFKIPTMICGFFVAIYKLYSWWIIRLYIFKGDVNAEVEDPINLESSIPNQYNINISTSNNAIASSPIKHITTSIELESISHSNPPPPELI